MFFKVQQFFLGGGMRFIRADSNRKQRIFLRLTALIDITIMVL